MLGEHEGHEVHKGWRISPEELTRNAMLSRTAGQNVRFLPDLPVRPSFSNDFDRLFAFRQHFSNSGGGNSGYLQRRDQAFGDFARD
jgi:hypothetical protein